MDPEAPRIRAPELDAGAVWLNTRSPLGFAGALAGRVVLLDFWTHGCINCLHVLADLRRLEDRHGPALTVVGVHVPKFAHEKDPASVRRAVLRYGVRHPVVCDPERATASAYTVRAWPTLVVVDPGRTIVGAVSGEGHHDLLDAVIADLVARHRADGTLIERPLELDPEAAKEPARDLFFPGKLVAADTPSGPRLFVADSGHHRLIVSTLEGEVTDVVGSGAPGAGDGGFAEASFRNPQGLAGQDGMLYVADTDNHLVRRVDLASRSVTTVAGTGAQGPAGNAATPGEARRTALSSPWDLAALAVPAGPGNGPGAGPGAAAPRRFLFIAMAGTHQVWCLDLDTGACRPFAGSGEEGLVDGARAEALFAQPGGLALHRRWLFVADSEASALRCIDLEEDTVTTAVGSGLFDFGDADGPWDAALLQHPLGLAADGPRLWIADTYNHKVKRADLQGASVRTLAGDGTAGDADGRPGRLSEPGGVAVAGGRVYVADTGNHRVRVLDPLEGTLSTLPLRPPPSRR